MCYRNFFTRTCVLTPITGDPMNRAQLAIGLLSMMALFGQPAQSAGSDQTKFKRVSPQYLAVLADPGAVSGSGAQSWGLWRLDPGPRGVRLSRYEQLRAGGNVAPAGWKFDSADWWLEENGLIMEAPEFPVPAGKYLVTGSREVTAVLTIHAKDADGAQRWELSDGAKIYDVTHLACRSARYTPGMGNAACSPSKANQRAFRVAPGAEMPAVEGCNKQDYAVLIVIGVAGGN